MFLRVIMCVNIFTGMWLTYCVRVRYVSVFSGYVRIDCFSSVIFKDGIITFMFMLRDMKKGIIVDGLSFSFNRA